MTAMVAQRRHNPPPGEYVRTDSPGRHLEWIEHLDGVEWWDAPVPRRRHRCRPQTRARVNGELIERCACGALAFDGDGFWIQRNSRARCRVSRDVTSEAFLDQETDAGACLALRFALERWTEFAAFAERLTGLEFVPADFARALRRSQERFDARGQDDRA